jgi:hypothetical protein
MPVYRAEVIGSLLRPPYERIEEDKLRLVAGVARTVSNGR